jgi:hypothetical protein
MIIFDLSPVDLSPVDGFFVVRLQSYLKHAKPLVLEEDFVLLWRCDYGIQCRIPSGWR